MSLLAGIVCMRPKTMGLAPNIKYLAHTPPQL